jgi:cytochrome P450 / NADPH-cytochrome P450 reductase
LTIKPNEFYVKASLRKGITSTSLCRHLQGTKGELHEANRIIQMHRDNGPGLEVTSDLRPITILYGSNSGTCESMAQRLATDAHAHGYRVTRLDSLDSGTEKLARDQPTIIFTASYEGQPPDNAAKFVQWLGSEKSKNELKGVRFAVFGCGNSEWPQTFHRMPKLVNETMSACGAEMLAELGLANAATEDCFVAFENWEDQVSEECAHIGGFFSGGIYR